MHQAGLCIECRHQAAAAMCVVYFCHFLAAIICLQKISLQCFASCYAEATNVWLQADGHFMCNDCWNFACLLHTNMAQNFNVFHYFAVIILSKPLN